MAKLRDRQYYIDLMLNNEEMIRNNSVAKIIETIKAEGENEGEEFVTIGKKSVNGEAFAYGGNEFIITDDGKLFFWRSYLKRIEIIDTEEEPKAEAFSFKNYEEEIKEAIREENETATYKWSVRVNKNSVLLHWDYEVSFKITSEDLGEYMEGCRSFKAVTDYGYGLGSDHVETFLVETSGDKYSDWMTTKGGAIGSVVDTIAKANHLF